MNKKEYFIFEGDKDGRTYVYIHCSYGRMTALEMRRVARGIANKYFKTKLDRLHVARARRYMTKDRITKIEFYPEGRDVAFSTGAVVWKE